MGFFTTRLLILTQHVDFSINIKRSLEKIGSYEVTPFSSAENALDHLQEHEQDIALIDFSTSSPSGIEIVEQIRAIQPNIAIIIGPKTSENEWYAQDLNVHLVDIPANMRVLLPLLQSVESGLQQALPDTAQSPIHHDQPETSQIKSPPTPKHVPQVDRSRPIEFIISSDDSSLAQITQTSNAQPQLKHESKQAIEIFEKLAAEEPPMPTFEESGTVSDLVIGVGNANMEEVLESFSDSESNDEESNEKEDSVLGERVPAALILEVAADDSTPLEAFSLTEFLRGINHPGIQPLPSWVRESEPYTEEPDFLPTGFSQILEYTSSITHPSGDQHIEEDPENLPTDPMSPQVRSRPNISKDFAPPPSLPEEEIFSSPSISEPEQSEQPEITTEKNTPEATATSDLPLVAPSTLPELPVMETQQDDNRITQLALALTQVSLETTAQATLLAKAGQIVAYAGDMAADDFESIRQAIEDDWEASPDKSRIRFINLPSNGADYMLYSRHTEGEFTLSLVFAGTMPLRVIRRQGKRLVDALQAVPEIIIEPEFEVESEQLIPVIEPDAFREINPETATYTSIATVWLLEDETQPLPSFIAQTLADDLYQLLLSGYWKIDELQVHQDHVYLFGEFPGEDTPNSIIRGIMKQSSAIVAREGGTERPAKLWSDSYLVVTPGRAISPEEIQRFIEFVRQ